MWVGSNYLTHLCVYTKATLIDGGYSGYLDVFVLVICSSVKSVITQNTKNLDIMALSRITLSDRQINAHTMGFSKGTVVTEVFLWQAEILNSKLYAIE